MPQYSPGKRLVIIGPASFGPYLELTPVRSARQAQELFGGQLGEAGARALASGAPDVHLLRCETYGDVRGTYLAMEDAYACLMPYPADIVLPLCVVYGYAQSDTELLWQALDFASERFMHSMPTVLVLSAVRVPGVASLLSSATGPQVDLKRYVDGCLFDYGEFVSVVVSYADYFDDYGVPYIADCAASYAGLITSLDPWVSPVNKSVSGVRALRENLFDDEASLIARAGFVCFVSTARRGHVPYCAVTRASGLNSRLVNVRLRNYIIQMLSGALMSTQVRAGLRVNSESAIQGAIVGVMEPLVSAGIVVSYTSDYAISGREARVSISALRRGEVEAIVAHARGQV